MGFFYRSSPGVSVDPDHLYNLTRTAYLAQPPQDPRLSESEVERLIESQGLGYALVGKKQKDKDGKPTTTSHNPSGRVLFFVALLLIVLYLMGFFLEGTTHAQASAIAFNAFQIAFPGFLGLLGLETAKHG